MKENSVQDIEAMNENNALKLCWGFWAKILHM